MKLSQNARDLGSRILVGGSLLAASIGSALADTDPVTDTLTAMTAKVTTYGGGLALFAAVGVAFAIGIKYVKKIPRAS